MRVRVVEVPLLFLIKGEAAADKWDSIMIRQRRQTMNTHSVFLGSNKLVFCTTTLLFSFFLLNMMIVVGGDQICGIEMSYISGSRSAALRNI